MEEELNGVAEDNSFSEVPSLITEMKNTPAAVESRVGNLSSDTGIVSTEQVMADGNNPIKTVCSNDVQNFSQVNAEEKIELDESEEDTMMQKSEEEKEEDNEHVAEETVSLTEEEDANKENSELSNEDLLDAAPVPVLEIVPVSESEDADETMDDQSDDTSAQGQNSIQSTDHTLSSDPMNIEIEEKENIDEDNEEVSSPFTLDDHILTPRTPPPHQPVEQTEHAMKLLSLPMDSLHCVASFLSASEWASFGQTSKNAAPVCHEIFRKVRMHGFRCATEILAAFKLGQHADARELSALYISAGVPVYPLSLGHSYHTLVLRMEVEAREMENQQENPADEEEDERRPLDAFYAERYESNEETETHPNLSYLEEKCWYCYNKEADGKFGRRIALTTRANLVPPVLGGGWQATQRRLPDFRPVATSPVDTIPQNIKGYPELAAPKVEVKIHRHLVDQHMMRKATVNDEQGAMQAAPISLAADFFHPQSKQAKPITEPVPDQIMSLGEIAPPEILSPSLQDASSFELPTNRQFEPGYLPTPFEESEVFNADVSVADSISAAAPQDPVARLPASEPANNASCFESPVVAQADPALATPPPPPQPGTPQNGSVRIMTPPVEEPSILTRVDLEIYHAASSNMTSVSDHREGIVELKSHLKTRFAVYQRRLEAHLKDNDSSGFEECILDFWDEFLPVTTNIHFYDGHTAVPRISGLHKFLTKPCPKSFGIVQCEIERIKSTARKKGVKGRLFPTYEYRLFIRDRRFGAAPESSAQEASPPRRDTVLMMAKNRGRKYQDLSGVVPATGSSKKGVNNYYLYMPQQADVDTHYRSVNSNADTTVPNPNGASTEPPARTSDLTMPSAGTSLLGRLQSNFIGTEFQIFTPTIQKRPARKIVKSRSQHGVSSDSESDLDYDSGFSSDNQTSTPTRRSRRNRFPRRSRSVRSRRTPLADSDHPHPIEEEGTSSRSPSPEKRKSRRSYSLPSFSYRKSTRSSRRAVAHSVDSPEGQQQQLQAVFCEEEDGAITYTANLLGNRPRIMDVCVPRVSDDGVPAAEWKRYLESVDDTCDVPIGSRMLNRFKQLQQRLENPDQNNNNNNSDDEGEVSDDDYTPPSDFGLLALQNRPPWWNIELGAFVLNFGGRVSVASVKNFQLCDRNDQEHIMLQFGRIQGRHSFTMDFQHPLTAVQAFAIAISSLQSRISFG